METVVSPRVQPRIATPELVHIEVAALQIGVVDGGDLKLAAGGRLDVCSDVQHIIVVEIEAGDRPVRFRLLRLLLDRQRRAGLSVEADYAVAFRIFDVIGENGSALCACGGRVAQFGKALTEIDIVAKDHCDIVLSDELAADDKGLGKAVWMWLHGVAQRYAELTAVTQKLLELGQVARRRNNQYLANTAQHQNAQRVVDHWFVIDRQDLLGDDQGERIKTRPAAAGQNDTLHGFSNTHFAAN